MYLSMPRLVRAARFLLPLAVSIFATSLISSGLSAQQLEQDLDRDASTQAAAQTYALPVVLPSEYNGDLRDLSQTSYTVPHYYHMWNEFDEPEPVRNQPQTPLLPGADVPNNQPLAPMPATSANFAGLAFNEAVTGGTAGAGWPPDVNGDVGPTVYIQAVNDAYAIYNKSTGVRIAAFTEASLWSTASTGTVCDTDNEGDPVVLHDALTDRWILTNFAFAFNSSGNEIAPFYQCFAVSKTSDPVAGGWYLYAVKMDTGGTGKPPAGTLNDYPKFGVWTDCLYMGANGFKATTGAFVGTIFASFSKSDMYSGAPLTSSVGFIANTNDPFTLIPSNLLGTSAASLPPTGTPNYFVSESNTAFNFEVRKFTSGANCGAGGTLGAAVNVTQTSYTPPAQNSVPQPNTTNKIDSLGDRLMQKVQYRKVGTAESLWVVHSTAASGTSTVRPQWAQINVTGGTVVTTPVQQQIYAPDTTLYRWMGSLAIDKQGDMAVGYSISNATSPNFPSIAYSGRLVGDTLNNLPQTETIMTAGGGSQTDGPGSLSGTLIQRWGDYSAMSMDPADDCTFWYTNEYYDTQANGNTSNWQTRIGSFKFPSCTTPANQTITFTSTAPTAAAVGGATYNVTATASSGLTVALTIDATASSVCSISGSTVSFIGVGNCIIDANQAGNASFNAAPQVQQTFAVGKGNQTITYTSTAPTAAVVGGATYTVTATGGASANAVTFAIDATASSICSISGSTVSFTGAGTCVIDANQAGNANYNAASQAQQSFAVGKANQTITYTSTAPTTAVVSGATYSVTATGGASGNPVTFAIDATASSVCSISGSTVSFTAAGTCVIDANQAGNANYNAASQAQQSFAVGKANQTITYTSTAPGIAVVGGATYNVTATGGASGNAVTFTIDATANSACSISGSTVSFNFAGTCVIDANQAGNANYNAAPQAQQFIVIAKGSQTITYTSTAPTAAAVGGATYNVTATASSGLTVTFTIDAAASSVCSIFGSTVSFIGAGTCVIDAFQAGNANYNSASAQQSFGVGKANQTITYTSTAPTTAVVSGATYNVTASGGASGNPVTFAIDATASSVCSISGSTVSFIGAGTCVIDANQAGNANYNAAPQAQQSFAVGKANQTITYTSTAPTTAVVSGATYSVTATGGASGNAVTFTIDATASSVCSISGSTVSFIGAGTCVIDANQAGNANYNAAPQAQQSFVVGKANQTITYTSTAPTTAVVSGATYSVTATGGASGNPVTFAIDATASSVCSISGSTVSFIGAGTCVIDANQAGNANYNAAPQAQQSFVVGKANQTITYTSTAPTTAVVSGATYSVTATGGASGNPVTFAIDATASSVCTISGSTVSFIGAGTCVIDANQAGNANYNPAPQAQQSFVVGKANQAITYTSTAPTTAVVGGATYSVTATGGASGNSVTFAIDAIASSVCSISGSNVSFIGAGTCVIDANQAGNSNYNAAPQAQQSFSVGKANQTITYTSIAPTAAVVAGATYTVTATGGVSGNAVTFAIDATASSVCTISGSTVSFIGAGTCVIDANQAGNANYNAAPQAQQSFAVGKANQAITYTSTAPTSAVVAGATYSVTATGGASGNAVTFAIDATASSVCTISGSTVSFIGAGTCVIDANQAGNANYNAAPQAQQSFAVGKANQAITYTSTAPTSAVVAGATYSVTATGGASGNAVTFAIDATASSVCTISGSTVSFIGAGTCVIDANQAGNANYNAAPQAQQSFAVGKANQAITYTSTAPTSAAVGGATYSVTATGGASGNPVTFAIDASASSICSISGSTVSFIAIGTCVIDANQAGNANYNGAAQVQQSFAVGVGAAAQLVFTLQPADVLAANAEGTVTVTEQDSAGDTIVGDSSHTVDFTVPACGGSIVLGSVTLVNGVGTLNSAQRFYTVTTGSQITAAITSLSLSAQSNTFNVLSNSDIVFADGFDGCRL